MSMLVAAVASVSGNRFPHSLLLQRAVESYIPDLSDLSGPYQARPTHEEGALYIPVCIPNCCLLPLSALPNRPIPR